MVIQQINLYLPELRPSRDWLTLNMLVACVLGIMAVFMASALYGTVKIAEQEKQVALVENQLATARLQLETTRGRAQFFKHNNLEGQIAYLKAAIEGRQQVGKIIAGQNLGNSKGFSQAFQALAAHSTEGFALDRIRLTQGGQQVELKGKVMKAEDVAVYLGQLRDDSAFVGSAFGLFSLAKKPDQAQSLAFHLGFESVYPKAEGDPGDANE